MTCARSLNFLVFGLFAILWLSGCQQQLMPTPNLIAYSADDPFRDVPPALQGNTVEIVYGTDRQPATDKSGQLRYGYQRSTSLAFGTCTVSIGKNIAWEELVRQSRIPARNKSLPLAVESIKELGRFPATPEPVISQRGETANTPENVAQREASERQLQTLLSEKLAQTPDHEVYIFVHGYNNTFQDAAFVMADLWHFGQRRGVPVFYTWPAGSSAGALGGYTSDRESGEFTVFHLKQFLRTVASCGDVQKIHLVAHSRGTDVLLTALRELHIEYRAAGKDTRNELKLGNLVLAAADLDIDVTGQRIGAERVISVAERLTVYVCQSDRAIGIADRIFGSRRRIGQLRATDLTPGQRKALESVSRMQLIDVRAHMSFLGHSYFHESPAVSSDLILLLWDNRGPGAENGRPLIRRQDNFWEIRDDYLKKQGS